MNEKMLCEKCKSEMSKKVNGRTLLWSCSNCGYSIATTYGEL